MKKIILASCIAALIAGTAKAQISFGPELGVNLTNVKAKILGGSLNGTTKAGLKLGIIADVPLGSNLYLQPGLLFANKGAKFEDDSKISINYLEVPVNLLYKFTLKSGDHIFFGAGPYFAYAAGGKATSYGYTTKLAIGTSDIDNVKPFDFGVGLNAGYQFDMGLFFRAQYQLGLVNVDPTTNQYNSASSVKNNGFSITAGWLFSSAPTAKKKKEIKH